MEYTSAQVKMYELSAKNIIEKKLNTYDFTSSCLEYLELDFESYISYIDIFYIGKDLPCTSKYILDNNASSDLNLTKIVNIKTVAIGKNVSSFLRYNLF